MIRPIALFLALSLPAAAEERNCFDPTTQLDMNICEYEAFLAADAVLNDVYAEALTVVQERDSNAPLDGASEEDRLRAAQRAWVVFRDANCDAAGYQMRGGSAEPLLINGCLRLMTEERTAQLETVLAEY